MEMKDVYAFKRKFIKSKMGNPIIVKISAKKIKIIDTSEMSIEHQIKYQIIEYLVIYKYFNKLTQAEIAKKLNLSEVSISFLFSKSALRKFSINKLYEFSTKMGLKPEIHIT